MSNRSHHRRLFAAFSLFLSAALAQQPGPPKSGEVADLVGFGHIKGWEDSEHEQRHAKGAGPPWRAVAEPSSHGFWNLGVEWDEPRAFSEVRVEFQEHVPAESVRVEYWVSSWPALEGRGGWTETDTPWRGEWKAVHTSSTMDHGTLVFRFDPLATDENPRAKNRPGYQPRFRRALKMRLRIESSFLPIITNFRVLGSSRWNEREVGIETGCEGKQKSDVSIEIYNGRLIGKSIGGGVTNLRVMYLEHDPESNDGTILTIGAADMRFGVAMDDLFRSKGIYVRDAGVFVRGGASGESFASYLAAGRLRKGHDIASGVARAGEQTLERAMSEIPALSMMYHGGGHPYRYIPVGFFGNREKYGIDFNGNPFISKHGSKAFQDELVRMQWNDDTLWFRIGTGTIPDFREREKSSRQHVVDDEQPIVITEWSNEGVNYREEAFATLLTAPLDPSKNRGDEISALLVKLTATNATPRPQNAVVWFHVSPREQLRLHDGILEGVADSSGAYTAHRFRAALQASRGEFQISPMPAAAEYGGSAPQWQAPLDPGSSVSFEFRLSFRTLAEPADIQRLVKLDYAGALEAVTSYWKQVLGSGMRLHVPDEILNRFYRSVLQHILISVERDVSTGLYMDPCGTYDYNIFANETNMQVRLLDMRGLHDYAAKFVEPLVALQGSKAFPGRFRSTDAIFHGARVDAQHDYTHSGYNLNHGWTLWTLAEHYLFTRDKEWLRERLPKMLKAADWIITERQATMHADEDGRPAWEYGLLPAGQLEDNEEWQYWFAVNGYAYRGLRAAAEAISELDPAQGKRLAGEALRYREDIRTAAFRSFGAAPVAPLRDGAWAPTMGSKTHLHGRDFGWIRNILYGPHALVDCGIFAPDEPVTGWILRDLEDNLFMSAESFNVAEQDWFSRGGITLQPNLVNTMVTYLERDELPQALRAFYNAFAVSYYPDVNAFTEWAPSFGKSAGPFFKTSDEAGSLTWLRLLLVREDGDKLYLTSGAPRRWFRPGQTIQVEGAATFFGPVSFKIESHPDQGWVDASVTVPPSFRGKEIRLRVRHPEGRPLTRVDLDGRPWAQFDPGREWISVPVSSGVKTIRAFFQ